MYSKHEYKRSGMKGRPGRGDGREGGAAGRGGEMWKD